MAVRFPHVGHSHGHSHSSRRHRAAIQLTLYCDAPRNTRYVSLYCPTPEYIVLQHTITVPVYTEYTLDCNYRLSLFSGANCPVHPACLYLDGHSVLTWMYAVCRTPAIWIPPPSRSIFFFLFYIHLLSGRICLVSSGVNPRFPLIYAAVSSLQLPVSMSSFPNSSLSMFAAVASVQQHCC